MIKENRVSAYLIFFISFFPFFSFSAPFHQIANSMNNTILRSKISIRYAQNDLLSANKISIDIIDGHVALSGSVNTEDEFTQAIIIAQSIIGVKTVNADMLSVTASTKSLKNIAVVAQLKGLFLQQKIFGPTSISLWPIRIEITDHTIEFSGKIADEKQKQKIIDLTSQVTKKHIIKTNHLKISPIKEGINYDT